MIKTCSLCNGALAPNSRYYSESGKICEVCYDNRRAHLDD
jgi:hypothetical protein